MASQLEDLEELPPPPPDVEDEEDQHEHEPPTTKPTAAQLPVPVSTQTPQTHNLPYTTTPAEAYYRPFPPTDPYYSSYQQQQQQQYPAISSMMAGFMWGAKPPLQTTKGWAGDGTEPTFNSFYYPLPRKRAPKKKKQVDIVAELEKNSDNQKPLDTTWKHLVPETADFVCPILLEDVPDALYLAMAQFQFCGVTQDDRIGKYKNRELGYVGICCRFCGGQPGFGRYFPGSYDSLLNGTNCDSIIKHIASECKLCPEEVSKTVKTLMEKDSDPTARPRYGSRKRFFSYVWTKLRQHELMMDENTPAQGAESPQDQKILECIADSEIVTLVDRHFVSDATLVAMAQMKVCYVAEGDRIGRCKDHPIGFAGLACKHCGGKAGKPGYGRYFPSSLRSLAQADSCQQMSRHLLTNCAEVPDHVRSLLEELDDKAKKADEGRVKYGSRMIFFKRVWGRIHENDLASVPDTVDDDSDIPWKIILGDSEVVEREDRGLIPDSQLASIAQMKVCKLTEADKVGWFKDREVGFGGLCCRYCGGRPSYGRYFPNSVRSFAQTTSSQTIVNHVVRYCTAMPPEIRDSVLKLQSSENETSTVNEQMEYGSRKIFFDRVWGRMHGTDEGLTKGAQPLSFPDSTVPGEIVDAESLTEEPEAKRPKLEV